MTGKKRRYNVRTARLLDKRVLVIDITPKQAIQIKKHELEIEKVKSTPKYEVYRLKR